MKKCVADLQVAGNRRVNREYFVLELIPCPSGPAFLPGNFAEFRVDDAPGTFLRRPISIYDIDPLSGHLLFLIQIVGEGTRRLSLLQEGERVNLIYPLGNSFSRPSGKKALLVGGGVGVAPLLYLGRVLQKEGFEPEFLLGFRDASLVVDPDRFEAFGKLHLTTDDGSAGTPGFVTDHPVWKHLETSLIYTCGPEIMMQAVARKARQLGIPCEASLENTMACGFGACLCCVQQTTSGNRLVCTDGPVFNTEELVW